MNVKSRTTLIACIAIAVLLAGCCPAEAPEVIKEEVVVTRMGETVVEERVIIVEGEAPQRHPIR